MCASGYLTLAMIGLAAVAASGEGTPSCPRAAALLEAGEQVRVVCFGDSITGVYYHTGGRRAWPAMLGIALQRLHPGSEPVIINAGLSGHSTVNGLERIERDVLRHKPQLVVVMFGMNDVAAVSVGVFHDNLVQIVEQCRSVGAEVVLCTPNSIYAEDERRPVARLEEFAETVRGVGQQLDAPVADCYRAYEDIRKGDRRAWMLLLSETIHPNMNGHKVFAREIARVISGRDVSVADVLPPSPAIPRTLALLKQGQPAKVIAMPPYDACIEAALRKVNPGAAAGVTPWPTEGKSLTEIEAWSQTVRSQKPDLVIVAVPATVDAVTEEQFIRSYSWVLNWSLSFGRQEWDCVAVLPSVAAAQLTPEQQQREALAREIIRGQDIGMIARRAGDESPAATVLARWVQAQAQRD